jgi:hypothetical protein
MELADVKVGETYLYTNPFDKRFNGQIVTVTRIDIKAEDDGYDLPWPVTAMFADGDEGAFDASELSPVVK